MDFSFDLPAVQFDPTFMVPPPVVAVPAVTVPVALAAPVFEKLLPKKVRRKEFNEEVRSIQHRLIRPHCYTPAMEEAIDVYGFAVSDSLQKEKKTKVRRFFFIKK